MENKAIIECVPNFSEGRDKAKIKEITDAIQSVEGISLLDVDPGEATNRTVVTFVGEPDAVVEAAFQGIKKAAEVIDMTTHTERIHAWEPLMCVPSFRCRESLSRSVLLLQENLRSALPMNSISPLIAMKPQHSVRKGRILPSAVKGSMRPFLTRWVPKKRVLISAIAHMMKKWQKLVPLQLERATS